LTTLLPAYWAGAIVEMTSRNKSYDHYLINDNVLPPDEFANLWRQIQTLRFYFPERPWNKVWQITDPPPVSSDRFFWSQRPLPYGLDIIANKFVEAFQSSNYYGSEGDAWTDIVFTVYLNGRGSRLMPHADAPHYVGAALYYAHPTWSSSWGGELVFPDVPPLEERGTPGPLNGSLFTALEDECFTRSGTGTYVAPTPNRMVLIRPNTWHRTFPVDIDAGNRLRCSISAFILQKKDQSKTSGNVLVFGD